MTAALLYNRTLCNNRSVFHLVVYVLYHVQMLIYLCCISCLLVCMLTNNILTILVATVLPLTSVNEFISLK